MIYQCSFIEIQEDGKTKVRYGNKHVGFIENMLFRVYDWHIEMDVLELIDDVGVKDIRYISEATGYVYDATLLDFLKMGCPHLHPEYGAQLFLPLSCWKRTILKTTMNPTP